MWQNVLPIILVTLLTIGCISLGSGKKEDSVISRFEIKCQDCDEITIVEHKGEKSLETEKSLNPTGGGNQ